MALHEQCVGATDEWYTPPHVFKAMGCSFDMDVASPNPPPSWIPAKTFYHYGSLDEGSLWSGFVWMNPPFGPRNGLVPWLEKFIAHGNGVGLVPDRTSAPWWQAYVPRMDLVLFVAPKLKFISASGEPGPSPAQGTCLVALGTAGVAALGQASRNGLGMLFEPVNQP